MPKLSKSAIYYRKNPAARKKKAETDKEINARPEQIKKRVEANRAVRGRKAEGKSTKGLDYDHAVKRFVKIKTNRGRKDGTSGDKKARGGK